MNKAAFLDRDGVINIDKNYVSKKEDFEFSEGIFELLHLLQQKGYLLIVITNQSGIGRGYYTLEDFTSLSLWMKDRLEKEGIVIDDIFFCPHSPEESCECRKPSAGMIEKARAKYDIDIDSSLIIGDKDSDMQAGVKGGIKNRIFIAGKEGEDSANATFFANSIEEITRYLRESLQ